MNRVLFILLVLLPACVPTGYNIQNDCSCELIEEKKEITFEVLNSSHFKISGIQTLTGAEICSYEISSAPKRDYSGLNDNWPLKQYRSECLSLFSESVLEDKNGNFYLCRCQK